MTLPGTPLRPLAAGFAVDWTGRFRRASPDTDLASTNDVDRERYRIGELYGIRVVPERAR